MRLVERHGEAWDKVTYGGRAMRAEAHEQQVTMA